MTARPQGRGLCTAPSLGRVWQGYTCAARIDRRRAGLPLAAVVIAAGLCIARPAQADDLQAFELAKNRIDSGQYNDAIERFAVMLDAARPPCQAVTSAGCRLTDPDLIERARTYYAVALVAVQRASDADLQIAQILRNNPTFSPDPALFPAEVIDRFTQVRGRMREELETAARKKAEEDRRARIAAEKTRQEERRELEQLRKLAGQEIVVEVHSRWIAALPFGVGQFQNGDKGLGWFFLASQAAMGGTSIVTSLSLLHYEGLNESKIDTLAVNSIIANIRIVNGAAVGAFASLVVAGVVQAQLAFVPEHVSTRPRRLPPPPSAPRATPVVSLTPGGVYFGVAGQF